MHPRRGLVRPHTRFDPPHLDDPKRRLFERTTRRGHQGHDIAARLHLRRQPPRVPSATVVMLRRSGDFLDWLVLADSVLILDTGQPEPTVITDDREAQVGASYRERMDSLDSTSPEHVAAHREYVETLRDHRNRDGGFWVASVDPLVAEQALTGSVPVHEVRAAALLSDGASRLVDRFHLTTWRDLLGLLGQAGPNELIRQVRTAEQSDPHGQRWPRGKTYDDAAVAYCRP